jgi:hypothetical protein
MMNELEIQLNDSSLQKRTEALEFLISTNVQHPDEQEVVNLHCHTFFSFNAYGYSPTALAWLAKQNGFKALGIVDFDVLDGVDEFLNTCERIAVRGSAGIETRVYIPEFSTREINSPGEPGIYYYMGIGFTSSQVPADVAPILADMRGRADQRNRVMVDRINGHLSPLTIDYDRDVLPLTPAGNATERHLLTAYLRAATDHFTDPISFWAGKLELSEEQIRAQIVDAPKFQNTIRAKLMKRSGVGYTQPGPDTFPSIEEFNRLIIACGALPCATWLDGMSSGEQSMEELLGLLIVKGAAALNIIPDRNWNIPDSEVRRAKVQKLYEVVELAQKLDLPLNIGTEMNSYGQKLVDDFAVPELSPIRQAFLDGADFVYGHTMMQRTIGLGYQSKWAQAHLPTRSERNAFYMKAGRQIPPGLVGIQKLKQLGAEHTPSKILTRLEQR